MVRSEQVGCSVVDLLARDDTPTQGRPARAARRL